MRGKWSLQTRGNKVWTKQQYFKINNNENQQEYHRYEKLNYWQRGKTWMIAKNIDEKDKEISAKRIQHKGN